MPYDICVLPAREERERKREGVIDSVEDNLDVGESSSGVRLALDCDTGSDIRRGEGGDAGIYF